MRLLHHGLKIDAAAGDREPHDREHELQMSAAVQRLRFRGLRRDREIARSASPGDPRPRNLVAWMRLRTYVLNVGFWNPALLARAAATTDQLSDGRLELKIPDASPGTFTLASPPRPGSGSARSANTRPDAGIAAMRWCRSFVSVPI
jgi:hypothetical protein